MRVFISLLVVPLVVIGCGNSENTGVPTPAPRPPVAKIKPPEARSANVDTKLKEAKTERDLGLPFYPGSSPESVDALSMGGDDGVDVTSVRSTSDDPARVIAFYRAKVTAPQVSGQSLTGKLKDGSNVQVMTLPGKTAGSTVVLVSVTKK